ALLSLALSVAFGSARSPSIQDWLSTTRSASAFTQPFSGKVRPHSAGVTSRASCHRGVSHQSRNAERILNQQVQKDPSRLGVPRGQEHPTRGFHPRRRRADWVQTTQPHFG